MEARSFATKVFRVGDFSVLFILDSGDLYPFANFLLFTAYTIGLVDSDRRELVGVPVFMSSVDEVSLPWLGESLPPSGWIG